MKKIILISLVPILVLVAMLASCAALAQQVEDARRWDRMVFLLEKTLLKVDAATATIELDLATAARLEELGAGANELDKQLDRDMAAAVFDTVGELEVELRFHVSFSKDRFLKSSRESLQKAREAGYIDEATEDREVEEMPGRFEWMSEDGIHDGDVMLHSLKGDSVRTRFITADGVKQLDRIRVGPERRMTLLSAFFGEKSDFRKGLFESFYTLSE